MKKIIKYIILILFCTSLNTVMAYEDCVITNDGKLTDIRIQNNDVIDVFPLVTILNDKNTLIVHPLKVGQSKFSVVKNKKDKVIFDVLVKPNKTIISEIDGFEIFAVDCPTGIQDYLEIEIDEPPMFDNNNFELDAPPKLRERS